MAGSSRTGRHHGSPPTEWATDHNRSAIRAVVISDALLWKVGDAYYSQDTFPDFLAEVASSLGSVLLCAPCRRGVSAPSHFGAVRPDVMLQVVELYPHASVLEFYKNIPKIVFLNWPRIRSAVKAGDVILFRLPSMNAFLGCLAAQLFRKTYFAYVVGSEAGVVRSGSRYKGWQRVLAYLVARAHSQLVRLIVTRAKAAFFLGESLRREFATRSSQGQLILTSLVRASDISRRVDTCSSTPPTLIYVGRLAHEKGVGHLLRAVRSLAAAGRDVQLKICGDGPLKEKLQAEAATMGLGRRVRFLGFVPPGKGVYSELDRADIFVLPSLSEGIPKVLLEAMARGLPIVATAVGGIPDIIRDGYNGLLVPPGDAEAIAAAVDRLLGSPGLRCSLIKAGYDFVRDHTIEKQALKLANTIRSKLGGAELLRTEPHTL